MENTFVTITGLDYYLGKKPYKVGRIVKIVKEPENEHDPEAIRVELPYIDTVGYIANSSNTVFSGTQSAGRIYDKFDEYAYAQIMFITHSSVIAIVIPAEEIDNEENNLNTSTLVRSKNAKQEKEEIANRIGF